MPQTQEQIEQQPEEQIDEQKVRELSYLATPKTFHLEMPLYVEFDLNDQEISKRIFALLRYRGTMDAYCTACDRESVFDAYNYLEDNISTPPWTTRHDGLIKHEVRCSRDQNHEYHAYYFKNAYKFLKVGQFPSVADFQIPQSKKYRAVLTPDSYKEFTKGVGLAAHGVGIGSFVYLRRIFEGLIENAHAIALEEVADFAEEDFQKCRMDEKIQMLRDYLPKFLVENRTLYSILSKGIHELSEHECLAYFDVMRIGIEQILDEKIEESEKKEKAETARKAVQGSATKLSSKK